MSTDSMVRGFVLVVVASCSSCRSTIVEPVLAAPWSAERAAAPLTREQCIDLALHSVPNEAAWSARVSSARAAVDRSALLANPIASLGFEDFGLNAKAAHNAVQTTLSIAAALEDVFARKRRHAAAVHDLEAEEATLRAERNRLAADVVRAYDELASARSKIELEERLSVIARDQRDAVRKFVAAGLAPRIQRDRADLELASTTASVERARADARELELLFAFALGFERPLTLALAEQPNGSTLTSERDIEALLTLASAARPEISAAKARYQAQLVRAHLASERIQFLPTVSAGPRRQDGELRGVAGLDVVLPIFDSGAVAEREQRAGLLAAAVELRRTAQQVAGEVSAALLRLETAESALTGSAGELAQRRRALREQTERLFAAGEVDYAELVSARRGEAEAQLARLDAERAASAARVEFDFATGAFERAVHEHISAENP